MILYLLFPLLVTLAIAAATQGLLAVDPDSSLGRTGGAFLGAQVLVVGVTVALALAELSQSREQRCPIEAGTWLLAIVLLVASAVGGGLVLATVIADARKHGGMLVWHLLAAPAAVLLPYVAGFAYLYWGLTCTS